MQLLGCSRWIIKFYRWRIIGGKVFLIGFQTKSISNRICENYISFFLRCFELTVLIRLLDPWTFKEFIHLKWCDHKNLFKNPQKIVFMY